MGSEGRERRAEEDEGNVITCQEPAEDQKRAERARADSEGLNDPAACEPSSFQSSQRPRSGEQPYTPKSSADKPAGTADHTSGTLDSAPASNPVSTVPGPVSDPANAVSGRETGQIVRPSAQYYSVFTKDGGLSFFGGLRVKAGSEETASHVICRTQTYTTEVEAARAVDRLTLRANRLMDQPFQLNFPHEITEQERAAVEKMTSQELWGYLLHATSGPAAPKGGVKAEEGKQVVGTQVTAGQGPAAGAEDASAERKMASRRQARRVDVIDQVPPPDHLKELQLTLYPSLSASSQRGGRKVAPDPRDDPTISPTRAARILNNRLSAARSKKRQREAQQLAKEEGIEVADMIAHMRRRTRSSQKDQTDKKAQVDKAAPAATAARLQPSPTAAADAQGLPNMAPPRWPLPGQAPLPNLPRLPPNPFGPSLPLPGPLPPAMSVPPAGVPLPSTAVLLNSIREQSIREQNLLEQLAAAHSALLGTQQLPPPSYPPPGSVSALWSRLPPPAPNSLPSFVPPPWAPPLHPGPAPGLGFGAGLPVPPFPGMPRPHFPVGGPPPFPRWI